MASSPSVYASHIRFLLGLTAWQDFPSDVTFVCTGNQNCFGSKRFALIMGLMGPLTATEIRGTLRSFILRASRRGNGTLPILFIPKDVQEGLAILRDIPDDVFNTVLVRLEHPESDSPITNLSPEDAEQVIDAITSMSTVRAAADVSVEQFIADVCESLREQRQLTPDKEPRLHERLARTLSIEILNVKAKAVALSNEHEHLFCTARIFTDVRPVYGEDVKAPPVAMTITHILKIDYHAAGGRTHEIYLGIGSGDIEEIREVLDRAEDKARSIRAVLESTKIPFIDPQE